MKRSIFALCVLASASGAACAQTAPFGVTLFGILDVNARSVHSGDAPTYNAEGTDGLNSSRLGFRGLEDLGDGLKAGFWLEAPIQPDTGTAGSTASGSAPARFFNRRATVSLIDPHWGEVRLGRDNTPAFTAYAVYDPFGTNGLGEVLGNGTSTGIISTLGSGSQTISRSDNQFSYFLPNTLGGLYGQAAFSPEEGVVGAHYWSGRLGYAAGPFDISGVYTETKVKNDDVFKQMMVGAAYDFQVVKISGQVVEGKYDSSAGGDRKQIVYQIGAAIPFGASIIRADYIHGDMSGGKSGSGFGDADDANQFAVGYQYNLSVRTALYGVASTLHNSGASKLVVASGYAGMKGGQTSTGFDIGVRHTF